MNTDHIERKPLKPLKDIDSYTRTRFLGIYIRIFPGLGLIGLFVRGVSGVAVAAFVSVILTIIVMLISDKIGGTVANTLYGAGKGGRSLREQLAGTLDQARYQKRQKQFEQALNTVNEILDQDPDFSDALFLKAQILWDGFGNSAAAQGYIKKVMKVAPNKDETLHRWASAYYDELTGMDKGQ